LLQDAYQHAGRHPAAASEAAAPPQLLQPQQHCAVPASRAGAMNKHMPKPSFTLMVAMDTLRPQSAMSPQPEPDTDRFDRSIHNNLPKDLP
jgi:hypothetical protein